MPQSALIVDDDRTTRRMVTGMLQSKLDLDAVEADNGMQCLYRLGQDTNHEIKFVILDLDMPAMKGVETLKVIKRTYPEMPVIVLTGSKQIIDAVQSMKEGAFDFLTKPADIEQLLNSARSALKNSSRQREKPSFKSNLQDHIKFSDLIGHQQGLAAVIKVAAKAAACDLSILVTGETGTGKEMLAHAIHAESRRASAPFIAVNCGAIPEKLVESTLFGHEKGAFTGAISKLPGKFIEANKGTIFLDEVGDLPWETQVKLLRALQQREVEPVGASRPVPLNVRVISATNRELSKALENQTFRQDLYFRLNVLQIHMPVLAERKQDIPLLARHFIQKFCVLHSISKKQITSQALQKFMTYSWPGNVRELENVIHRALILAEGESLDAGDFILDTNLPHTTSPQAVFPIRNDGTLKSLESMEQEIIRIALDHNGKNITRTAHDLGLAKSTLYAKLENKRK